MFPEKYLNFIYLYAINIEQKMDLKRNITIKLTTKQKMDLRRSIRELIYLLNTPVTSKDEYNNIMFSKHIKIIRQYYDICGLRNLSARYLYLMMRLQASVIKLHNKLAKDNDNSSIGFAQPRILNTVPDVNDVFNRYKDQDNIDLYITDDEFTEIDNYLKKNCLTVSRNPEEDSDDDSDDVSDEEDGDVSDDEFAYDRDGTRRPDWEIKHRKSWDDFVRRYFAGKYE